MSVESIFTGKLVTFSGMRVWRRGVKLGRNKITMHDILKTLHCIESSCLLKKCSHFQWGEGVGERGTDCLSRDKGRFLGHIFKTLRSEIFLKRLDPNKKFSANFMVFMMHYQKIARLKIVTEPKLPKTE